MIKILRQQNCSEKCKKLFTGFLSKKKGSTESPGIVQRPKRSGSIHFSAIPHAMPILPYHRTPIFFKFFLSNLRSYCINEQLLEQCAPEKRSLSRNLVKAFEPMRFRVYVKKDTDALVLPKPVGHSPDCGGRPPMPAG